MTVLRLQRHVNEKDEWCLEIISGNINNVIVATDWRPGTNDEFPPKEDIMALRMKVVDMLADLHNMLSNELRIA